MSEHEPVFAVSVRDSLAGPVLECCGELDFDEVSLLHAALNRAISAWPAPLMVVVDFGAVTFMDSAGLNTLLLARREAARRGITLRLARASGSVARVLEITGADRVFPVDGDVPATRPAD